MVNNLKKDYRKIENLGVKYALFYVLVGAEMPSILAEISFISNREEEKRLSGENYKKKIAEAIAKGVGSYITKSTLIVKPVRKGDLKLYSSEIKETGDNIRPRG
jgi:N-acetylmuramoyl-L-alanine amidase